MVKSLSDSKKIDMNYLNKVIEASNLQKENKKKPELKIKFGKKTKSETAKNPSQVVTQIAKTNSTDVN